MHLHVHSNFSYKMPHPTPRADQSRRLCEMPAVALTDHSTLAEPFAYRAAQGSGVKPIIGIEIELTSGHHLTIGGNLAI